MTEPTKHLNVTLPPPRCYEACRYSQEALRGRLYTPDHYWLQQESPHVWRVGLTPWIVRMLGDIEAYRINIAPGAALKLNDALGTVEGLKAVVKLRAPVAGTFLHCNPMITGNPGTILQDCCGSGWLYLVQGTPDPETCDVAGYRQQLDESIETVCGAGPQFQ